MTVVDIYVLFISFQDTIFMQKTSFRLPAKDIIMLHELNGAFLWEICVIGKSNKRKYILTGNIDMQWPYLKCGR